jgi:hypothetical protein
VREVPRVAEPVREVVTSPDEEILEDHDIVEFKEPPQMTISHKRKPAWARELIQDGEKYGVPEGTTRQVKRPKPFSSYMALMCDLLENEPTCFEEAIQKKEWADAMTEEYQSIIKNDVWEIVPRLKSKDVVSSKWLFKIKHAADGSIEKYKAGFVAHGFSQKEGIDSEETFALVARYTLIRTIIALAAKMKWKLRQMDVKTTFLNGVIEEEVYIEQPQGFEVEERKTHVCKLKKALYGLKQAPRAWYGRIYSFLTPMETKLMLLVDTSSKLIDATLYRQIIGSLMYLTNTSSNIYFSINTLSQFLVEPRHVHLVAAKHVMRYLKGTLYCGLSYDGDHDFTLSVYTNSDWAGSVSDRKNTSMCCFSLGSAMISWQSRKQSNIALNTAEA